MEMIHEIMVVVAVLVLLVLVTRSKSRSGKQTRPEDAPDRKQPGYTDPQ